MDGVRGRAVAARERAEEKKTQVFFPSTPRPNRVQIHSRPVRVDIGRERVRSSSGARRRQQTSIGQLGRHDQPRHLVAPSSRALRVFPREGTASIHFPPTASVDYDPTSHEVRIAPRPADDEVTARVQIVDRLRIENLCGFTSRISFSARFARSFSLVRYSSSCVEMRIVCTRSGVIFSTVARRHVVVFWVLSSGRAPTRRCPAPARRP